MVKISAGGEETLNEIGGFNQIAAIVVARKGDDFAGIAIEPMGVGAMEGLCGIFEEGGHFLDAGESLCACDESAVDPCDDGHDAHAGATGGNQIAGGVPFAGHT